MPTALSIPRRLLEDALPEAQAALGDDPLVKVLDGAARAYDVRGLALAVLRGRASAHRRIDRRASEA